MSALAGAVALQPPAHASTPHPHGTAPLSAKHDHRFATALVSYDELSTNCCARRPPWAATRPAGQDRCRFVECGGVRSKDGIAAGESADSPEHASERHGRANRAQSF